MTNLQPPGETSRVESASALVLAPHYDDEVLGCGGLVAQLASSGAEVGVVFLTDGAALPPAGTSAEEYSRRRRAEAQAACAALGVSRIEHLDLPDGQLAHRVAELAALLEGLWLEEWRHQRPLELLLVPSPLELTADHRAAFAAVHRALAPVRGDGELAMAVAGLRVLAYEVNRLLYPDLLIDVTAELPKLEEAMAAYVSQQERHDYLAAKLGICRYRTFSVPGDAVEAVEAYRALEVSDFATRSPAQLIAHLGGVAELVAITDGPPVSLIVRTKDRPDHLARALASVAASHYRNVEVVLVNDGGAAPRPPADFPFPLIRIELPEDLGRARAAQAGVAAASGEYVGFLDDDDVIAPEHLATLVELVGAAGVRVAYTDAAVAVYELAAEGAGGAGDADGLGAWRCVERRLPYSRDFDPDVLLLDNYIPFNTLLIERALFAEAGPFDESFAFFEDWEFLIRLARQVPFHHLRAVTCEYRHFRGAGHHILGDAPRSRADFLEVKARVLAKHRDLLGPERLARAVDTLRREAVERGEQAALLERERVERQEELRAAHRRLGEEEGARHRLHGEVVSLRQESERLHGELEHSAGELRRLYEEEARLRKELSTQTETVAATYAEIERLGGIIHTMESTRAWRWHQRLQRRRS